MRSVEICLNAVREAAGLALAGEHLRAALLASAVFLCRPPSDRRSHPLQEAFCEFRDANLLNWIMVRTKNVEHQRHN